MARASMVRWCGLIAGLLLAGVVGCKTTKTTQTQQSTAIPDSEFKEAPTPPSGGTAPARPELKSVYFDYDRSEIRPDARSQPVIVHHDIRADQHMVDFDPAQPGGEQMPGRARTVPEGRIHQVAATQDFAEPR